MRQTNKRRKKPARNVNHVSHVSHAKRVNLVLSVKSVPHAKQRMKRPRKQPLQQYKPLHALACHAFKRSACLWLTCKRWRKAAA